MTNLKISDTILIRLERMGLKQKDLAFAINVPPSTLNTWLKRDIAIPANYILDICNFLECSVMYLLTGDITHEIDMDKFKNDVYDTSNKIDNDNGKYEGLSDDALRIAMLWNKLDEPGKAIIQGKIYERLENMLKNVSTDRVENSEAVQNGNTQEQASQNAVG